VALRSTGYRIRTLEGRLVDSRGIGKKALLRVDCYRVDKGYFPAKIGAA